MRSLFYFFWPTQRGIKGSGAMSRQSEKMAKREKCVKSSRLRKTKKTNSNIYEDVRCPDKSILGCFFLSTCFSKQNALLWFMSLWVSFRDELVISDANVSHSRPRDNSPFFFGCPGGSLAPPSWEKIKTLRNILIKIHCPKKEKKRNYQNHRQTG